MQGRGSQRNGLAGGLGLTPSQWIAVNQIELAEVFQVASVSELDPLGFFQGCPQLEERARLAQDREGFGRNSLKCSGVTMYVVVRP